MQKFRRSQIFLAEDSSDDIEITRRAFHKTRLTCDLIVARDGEEALRMLRELPRMPDLMLLDLNLPKINGLQVLEAIRADRRFVAMPIIVLSASVREEDVIGSYERGANSYIQKPVVFDDFIATLEVLHKYWFDVARLPRCL